jgi:hypothetical protein
MKYLSFKIDIYCVKIIILYFSCLMGYFTPTDATSSSICIDISYSTYFGGSSDTVGYGIAVDKNGNAFITGFTHAFDLPVTERAYQKKNARFIDAFVAKIGIKGDLLYATYLGEMAGTMAGI